MARLLGVDRTWWPALVLGANLLPVVAYATGSLLLVELFATYVLETVVAVLAVGARRLVVGSPGDDGRRRVRIEPAWLPSRVVVTISSLAGAVRVVAWGLVLLGVAFLFLGVLAGPVLLYGQGVASPERLSFRWIATAALGLVVLRVVDFGRFLADGGPSTATVSDVDDRLSLVLTRCWIFAYLLGFAVGASFFLPFRTGLGVLLAFVAVKAWVELRVDHGTVAWLERHN